MKFRLRKLFFLFIFLLIFYAIYFAFMNKSFIKLNELNYEPVNYRNFGQMNRLRNHYNVLNKIKNEKSILTKLKSSKSLYEQVDCIINGEYSINCLKSVLNQNVFMPFSFIRDYFDVYGNLDKDAFHFEHSYSRVYLPKDKYDYRKNFLWFENYAVENRPRVKYISSLYNVPLSSQWDSKGHFYPIQIAQFGLSHFSKFLSNGQSKFIYLDVDKFMRNDLKNLKFDENDLDDVESKIDESITSSNQLNIDQLVNDDLNQTFNDDVNRKILFERLRRRKLVKIIDAKEDDQLNDKYNDEELNEPTELNEEEELINKSNKDDKTIYLNQTSLILTTNFSKRSSFYNNLFLSFKFRCIKNLRITVILMNPKKIKFKLNYKNINHELFKNDNLVYGIGDSVEWRIFSRDLKIDLIKSINLFRKKKSLGNVKFKNLHLYRIILNGHAFIKEIKLSSNGNFYQFINAVNWFIMKQDEDGGWQSKVSKRLVSKSLSLKNSWQSSMALGHGISLLIRAFHFRNEFNLIDQPSNKKLNFELFSNSNETQNYQPVKLINDELLRLRVKNKLERQITKASNETAVDDYKYFIDEDNLILNNSLIYLNVALNAVAPFKKNISDNGVTTYFMDKYIFYEEFPTQPSLFVLNGFAFSLIGLYDIKMTLNLLILNQVLDQSLNNYYSIKLNEIEYLFNEGMNTLRELLPLYDTGSASLYDLSHFTLKRNVNIARWDYHSVHINLLLHLNTLFNDRKIRECAQRWLSYMKGKRAKHN